MKTISIILTVLFAIAVIFFIVAGIKAAVYSANVSDEDLSTASETEPEQTSPETETFPVETTSGETAPGTFSPEDENIREVNFYLDGDKENGTFLGTAEYGLPSEDAASVYGDDFSNFGFFLSYDTSGLTLEPGTIHSLYIYTLIPAYGGEQYIRKEITVPGQAQISPAIRMSSDSLGENTIIEKDKLKEIKIDGWAINLSVSDSTGINNVEIFLDGPKNSGRLLGQAQYGIERQDVANAFGNANYTNCGYQFSFDGRGLDEGSSHRLYIYGYSPDGTFSYISFNFSIEGDGHGSNVLVNLSTVFEDSAIKLSGWAVNKDFITQGVPKSTDIDYSIKKIVFVSNKSGNEDIWSMNLDGSELTQLTDNPENDQYPSVSLDGKKIAYASYINGIEQIVTMNWDGTDKKQITLGQGRHAFPSWSFDGKYLFLEVFTDDNWELFVMESDGSNMKRLTINPGVDDWHPSAHPFLYKTLYEVGYHGGEEIWEVDIEGDDEDRISEGGRNYRVPKYSIDAEHIAFMGYDDNKKEQVFIMDSDGDNIKQLTGGDEGGRLPSFSPDNRYIAYNSAYGGADIFIMNTDGSDKRLVLNIPGEDSCAVFLYQE